MEELNHQGSLSRERNVALKAHEAVEQRRKKQSEFINNVDEKSLLLRDKIKKRMEVINARKEKAEQMEKEKVQEEMQRKRQELIVILHLLLKLITHMYYYHLLNHYLN